ncbi:hypothetical protein E1B28_000504 [Marasmius oreades]|uniref:Uncharacterized protein n=1 Tax=Marasmius oreades TaxID=181124 RepID=A0A9P7V1E0_9AGAR|nr:uncharacterized protein E1B28_000504 [Marasmius oreades]KAG7098571.1 hypothetical protein E1B28_000504 [Marasmius oreades]
MHARMVCGTVDATKFYLHDFQEHVSAFQRHLLGVGEKELSSSTIPPCGYWTPPEKERFFHSLSIHTRFRPDLIALDIKSKTVADVCFYLAALEQASAKIQPIRNDLDIAITVSDSWISVEEGESYKLKDTSETFGLSGEEWDVPLDSDKLRIMDQILREGGDFEDSTDRNAHFPTSNPSMVDGESPSTSNGRPTDSEIPLSPASRRRLYKRLYMRRKRAGLSGTTADLHADKLQPGKKTKILQDGENDRDELDNVDDDALNDADLSADEQETEDEEKETSVQLEREAWKQSGVDADVLVSRDLGLFYLGALRDLMSLYKLTSDERLPAAVTSSISAATIQTLGSIVKNFVTDIIHHCIVLREEERRVKGQTKVWRFGSVHEEISSNTVNHALTIMGHSRTRKNIGLTEAVVAKEREFDALETSATELQHGQLAPALMFCRLPKNLDESDELMPTGTDEEALLLELESDMELDEYDRAMEIAHEHASTTDSYTRATSSLCASIPLYR